MTGFEIGDCLQWVDQGQSRWAEVGQFETLGIDA
jgi:hypothetical protein